MSLVARSAFTAPLLPRLPLLMMVLLAAVAEPARADPQVATCHPALALEAPLADREGALARFELQPEHCLKRVFRDCAALAGETMLDGGSAARCSVAYEALLRRSFRGDFHALLAWWRSDRDQRR